MTKGRTKRLIIAMQEVRQALFDAFMAAVEDKIICEELPAMVDNPLDPIDEVVNDAVTDLELLDLEDDPTEAVEKGVARVVDVWQAAYGPARSTAH